MEKIEIGMEVLVPRLVKIRRNMIKEYREGTVVSVQKNFVVVKLDKGYNESYRYNEIKPVRKDD